MQRKQCDAQTNKTWLLLLGSLLGLCTNIACCGWNVGGVKASSSIPVTGVAITTATASLTIGGSTTLSVTITPSTATNKTVTWSSDTTSVATVNDAGIVSALSSGSTNITATSMDGTNIVSAICVVTVIPATAAAPTGVTAISGDGVVSLSWSASTNAASYNVKRGTKGGPYTLLGTTSTLHYSDPGLVNGTAYYYVVSATDAAGEGPDSNEVTATPSSTLGALPAEDSTKNHIGLGTWFLNDWDQSFAFVDAIKHARPWQDATNWSNPVGGVDSMGWPTADASTVIFTGTPAQVNGTYKLVFVGQADVSLLWYAGLVENKIYDSTSNTTTADVTINISGTAALSGGLVLKNTKRTSSSATNTGFTNMHLYRPGYATDGSAVFTKPFLNALSKASAVRMMDWTNTNDNATQHWSERLTPEHMYKAGPGYTGQSGYTLGSSNTGIPIEEQIQLCNALMSDCWINIPVAADDDYVQNTALALRYGTDGTNPYNSTQATPVYPPLDPSLHIYLEYANEIWNSGGGFYNFYIIEDIVKSLPAGSDVLTPTDSSVWDLMWRYPAYRMAVVSDIFRNVYGDTSMMNRVRPLLMTQQGNGQATLSQALLWLDNYAQRQISPHTVNSYIYGAGGSGYYGVNNEPPAPTEPASQSDLTTLVNAYFATGNYPETNNVKGIGTDAIWAANYGLKRIAYEGGPSLDSFGDTAAAAINADSRMQDMVVKTHDAWSSQGGDLLMYYTLVGPPKWEFTPNITTTNTPKFAALEQLQSQPRAAVTLGGALPGSVIAHDWLSNYSVRSNYGYTQTIDNVICDCGNSTGDWITVPANTSKAFTGNLTVNGRASSDTRIAVWVNGVRLGEVTLIAGTQLADSTKLSIAIPAGLSAIRLEVVSGSLCVYSLSVQ